MAFLEDLRQGKHGLTFAVPASFHIEQEHEHWALLRDETRQVNWHIGLMAAMVDLDSRHGDLLKIDVEIAARADFEAAYHSRDTEALRHAAPPRTGDPTWTPVVSIEPTSLGGAPALEVIRRTAYEPGNEAVTGHLLIPLETGTLHFTALCRTSFTGYRESVLTDARWKQRAGESLGTNDPKNGWGFPPQAEMDDPFLDERWPEHPLSLVRGALCWLRDATPGIAVERPSVAKSLSRIVLPQVGCSITPPPRFLLAPRIAEQMSPSLAVLTRDCLPGGETQAIDVWRLPDCNLRGIALGWRLRSLAAKTIRGWAEEGASDIELEIKSLPKLDGREQVSSYVRFFTAAGPTHSLSRWIADLDGVVFRLSAGGPPNIEREELEERVQQLAGSWSRLP